MVQARTREMAVAAGRNTLQVTQSDYEQARRDLTGETEMGRQEAVLDAPAAAERTTRAAVDLWENEGGQVAGRTP